jgi:hypothetical protein
MSHYNLEREWIIEHWNLVACHQWTRLNFVQITHMYFVWHYFLFQIINLNELFYVFGCEIEEGVVFKVFICLFVGNGPHWLALNPKNTHMMNLPKIEPQGFV